MLLGLKRFYFPWVRSRSFSVPSLLLMKLYHRISPAPWPGIHKNNATAYIFFWLYFPEPISHRLFISHSPESRKEERFPSLYWKAKNLKPNKIVHSCVTPAVPFMIPYALLNGVSLSWCSLTERLIKRLIKAESVIKEIDFNLQGERGEENRKAGEISSEGTAGMPWFAMLGQGAF